MALKMFGVLVGLWALAFAAVPASAQRAPASTDTTADMTTLVPGTFVKFAGDAGDLAVYRVEVPAGQKRLSISTRGQRGNVDLYLVDESVTDFGRRPPSRAVLADRAIDFTEGPTSRETLTVFRPAAGTHYAIVRAADDARNIRVSAWVVSRPGHEFTPVLPVGQTVLMNKPLTYVPSQGGYANESFEFLVNADSVRDSLIFRAWGSSRPAGLVLEERFTSGMWAEWGKGHVVALQPTGTQFVAAAEAAMPLRNTRLRVDVDAVPKVLLRTEVSNSIGKPTGCVRCPRSEIGVFFYNDGTRQIAYARVVAVRMDGNALPISIDPTGLTVSAQSRDFEPIDFAFPIPLSTGMSADFEIDVEFTDFRGRTWTQTIAETLAHAG